MSISNSGDDEPLAVSPRRAAYLLDCGVTRIYELINRRDLASYKDGAARKVVVASIHGYIARKIGDQ